MSRGSEILSSRTILTSVLRILRVQRKSCRHANKQARQSEVSVADLRRLAGASDAISAADARKAINVTQSATALARTYDLDTGNSTEFHFLRC